MAFMRFPASFSADRAIPGAVWAFSATALKPPRKAGGRGGESTRAKKEIEIQ